MPGLGPGLGEPPNGDAECGYPFDISSIDPVG